ncbi:MAG: HAMP domain-containing histidine kinase [Syntrophomonadaceae bacterium]|nr:HAMP domain-containing histidine kinase [Syntrophomonadaceae bacterium]
MGRSIFSRLLSTYLLLMLLLTGSLAGLLSYGFSRYIYTEKTRVFNAAATRASIVVNGYYQGDYTAKEMQIALDNLGYITDTTIYALKLDQADLHGTAQAISQLQQECLPGDLRQILNGESVFRKKQFSRMLEAEVAFLGTPLRVDGKIIGAILIFSPLSETRSYLARINGIIGGTAVLFLIISFFIIYLTAARISRPIRKMEQAVLSLAAGEDLPELSIKTGDEVEFLANSLNHMQRQIETTERIRREFIANVSHDLRTPLTSINGFIQGMVDGLVPLEQYPRYLGLLQDETRRLMTLTGDILELAKLQGDGIALHKSALSVLKTLEELARQFRLGGEPGLLIRLDCPPDLQVIADHERLQQILYNLISNAVRYSGESGEILIIAGRQENRVHFFVKDSGPGVAAEDLPFIFERFYRGQKHRPGEEGSGLGLSIVKDLVELHGGSISAESKPGQGAVFTFWLPA